MHRIMIVLVAAVSAAGLGASQDLVYDPINPSFGGNPFNSSHLLGIANSQNDFEAPVDETGESQADLFLRQLESRLLSGLAGQVTEAIFGDDPQESGIIQFDTQTIEFVRGLDSVTISVFDVTTGQTTEIILPIFAVN
ncbi:MAG: curli assembly protein CsgF [Pseudomonadota bacterium]